MSILLRRYTGILCFAYCALFSVYGNAEDASNLKVRRFEDFMLVMNCEKRAVEFFYYETQPDTGNAKRSSSFYKDKELPEDCQQSSTNTYKSPIGTFDRGHMVPANHFDSDKESIYATNIMSNIHPQHPGLNRGAWLRTEEMIECMREDTKLQVFGGPIWGSNEDNDYFLNSHGIVTADYFWKVVFNPKSQELYAWIFPNDAAPTKSKTNQYRVSFTDLLEQIKGTSGEAVMWKFVQFNDAGAWPEQSCNLS
tara:strand:- start:43196 stop:43951 length:756 start_codon:yes stop_codon:yes gene_type:complete